MEIVKLFRDKLIIYEDDKLSGIIPKTEYMKLMNRRTKPEFCINDAKNSYYNHYDAVNKFYRSVTILGDPSSVIKDITKYNVKSDVLNSTEKIYEMLLSLGCSALILYAYEDKYQNIDLNSKEVQLNIIEENNKVTQERIDIIFTKIMEILKILFQRQKWQIMDKFRDRTELKIKLLSSFKTRSSNIIEKIKNYLNRDPDSDLDTLIKELIYFCAKNTKYSITDYRKVLILIAHIRNSPLLYETKLDLLGPL